MPKPSGSKGHRLSSEERLLEQQREEILRQQQILEKKLKRLPLDLEKQEQQKRKLTKLRAEAAAPPISPYLGRSGRKIRGKGRGKGMPSRQRSAAQIKTFVLFLVLILIVFLIWRQIPNS